MTEAEKSPAIESGLAPRRSKRRAIIAGLVVALAVALAAACMACPWILNIRNNTGTSQDLTQVQERLVTVEHQIETINGRLSALDAQAGKNADTSSKDTNGLSAAAVMHMQSDLVTLSSAVGTLQAQLKQAGSIAAHVQQTAQSSLAAAMAFIQLRAAAEAGRGFVPELTALRAAVKSDSVFQEATSKLEPYAVSGAPTTESLRAEFFTLESSSVAMDKSAAQNWHERLWAEMKGLVSVRPLHGNAAADAFTATEQALASGDLGAALAAEASLPASAQGSLKEWRGKAEARATVEGALHELSDHFIALAATPVPAVSTEQDEP